MKEAFDLLDFVAGFSGALLAVLCQPRVPFLQMLASLTIGAVSAMYGAPALDAWLDMPDPMEHFYAFVIGMTAQTYLIPGLFTAAGVIAAIPAQWIKRRFGNHEL